MVSGETGETGGRGRKADPSFCSRRRERAFSGETYIVGFSMVSGELGECREARPLWNGYEGGASAVGDVITGGRHSRVDDCDL